VQKFLTGKIALGGMPESFDTCMKTNVQAVGVMGTGAVQVGRRLLAMGDKLALITRPDVLHRVLIVIAFQPEKCDSSCEL
jgi:hypothetical protein